MASDAGGGHACTPPSAFESGCKGGAPLLLPGLISIPKDLKKGTELMVSSLKDEAVGFVKLKADSNDIISMESGEIARPSMVLMDTDVYPRRWPASS